MYGDPDQIRAVATRLRAVADDVSTERAAVVAGMDVDWQSAAATAFRDELTEWAGSVGRSVEEIVQAAAAVDRHADEVEEKIELIRAAEEWARQEIADLRDTVSGVGGHIKAFVGDVVSDAVDFAKVRLGAVPDVLPSPGDLGWLDVRDGLRGSG